MQFPSNRTGVNGNEIIALESMVTKIIALESMATEIIALLLTAHVQVLLFLAMKMNKEYGKSYT